MSSSVSGSGGRFSRVLVEGLPFGGLGRFCAELTEMGEVVIPSDSLGLLLGDEYLTWRGQLMLLLADWEYTHLNHDEDVLWYVRGMYSYMVYIESAYRLEVIEREQYLALMDSLGAKLVDVDLPEVIVYFEERPLISKALEREMNVLSTCYGVWCGMMRGLGVQVYVPPPLPSDVCLRESWAVGIWQDLCGLLPSTT